MKKIILLTAALLILNVTQGYCWGSKGHKIVAGLAKDYLDKSVVDSVQVYLGATSFEEASVWMDEVRSDHSYDYMKPMHYINVEKDKTYVKVKEPNLVNELELVIEELKTKKGSKEDVKKNLLILFHLVGDLHQPLHTGYSIDKGGNSVAVDFLGAPANLHWVWDTKIIDALNINSDDCRQVQKTFSSKRLKQLQKIDPVEWLEESRQDLDLVYSFENKKIDSAYTRLAAPVIEKRLTEAGIRLASVLNETFSKKIKPLQFSNGPARLPKD